MVSAKPLTRAIPARVRLAPPVTVKWRESARASMPQAAAGSAAAAAAGSGSGGGAPPQPAAAAAMVRALPAPETATGLPDSAMCAARVIAVTPGLAAAERRSAAVRTVALGPGNEPVMTAAGAGPGNDEVKFTLKPSISTFGRRSVPVSCGWERAEGRPGVSWRGRSVDGAYVSWSQPQSRLRWTSRRGSNTLTNECRRCEGPASTASGWGAGR